jgi:O-antigen/teichoic acid export membrane protein
MFIDWLSNSFGFRNPEERNAWITMVEQVLQEVRIGARRLVHGALRRPFVRHVGVLTVANGVGAVLSVVQGILVARWLGPELYGVAALVMSVPSLVYTFFDARSAEASVKFLSEFDARGERERALAMCKVGYTVDFTIAMVAFLVILLLSPWAAKSIVKRPEMGWLIILYGSAFLPRALTGTSYAVLATLGRFPSIALIDTLTNILRVGLVLVLVGLGWQVAGVVWGNALAMAATGLLYGILAYGLAKSRWGRSWFFANWSYLKGRRREVIRFFAYNDLNALLGMIPKQLDVVLLGYFHGPTEAGYYKLAKSLVGVMAYITGPLQAVVYPRLAQAQAIQSKRAVRAQGWRLTWSVGLPLALSVVLAIPFASIILIFVGEAYKSSIHLFQLFLVLTGWQTIFFWLRPAYWSVGMLSTFISISTVCTIALLGLWLISIPISGSSGLILATIFISILHIVWLILKFNSALK